MTPDDGFKWQVDIDTPHLVDTDEFRDYADMIEHIVHSVKPTREQKAAKLPGEITIRGIHEALGPENIRRAWTIHALEWLDSIEAVGVVRTRYRKIDGIVPRFTKSKRWNGKAMEFLFARPNTYVPGPDTPRRYETY